MKKSSRTIPNFTVKSFKRKVGGIIFLRQIKGDVHFFKTVHAWLENKAPDNSIIYDSPEILKRCNIPILDSIYNDGVFYKIPKLRILKTVNVSICPAFTPTLLERTVKQSVNSIKASFFVAGSKLRK